MKLLIASPTYDGSVRMEYMRSVMQLTDALRQAGIGWSLRMEPATLLHVMRSVMASEALMDESYTHVLFVDTDMRFGPSAVRKLIESGRDVIGCAYPYRTIALHNQVGGSTEDTFRQAISKSVPYAVALPRGTKTLDITNGICEVQGVGTGLMLISTKALRLMREKGCAEGVDNHFPYNQWYRHPQFYGFFEHVRIGGRYLGEDYSFCHRWREDCGGKVYAVVNEEIAHIGPVPILGRYLDKLQTGKL